MAVASGKNKTPAAISAASSGVNTIVKGAPGKSIYVSAYLIVAAGAVTATWQDSSASPNLLSGAMAMVTGSAISNAIPAPDHIFTVAPGKDLTLNLSGAVHVSGHLGYWVE
jgi:hypothetical protein